MSWARFDDGYDDNPKVIAAGKDGRALDQAGIRRCARLCNDGVLPDVELPVLAAKADVRLKATVRRLVEVGRWHTPGHGCVTCPPCPPGHHVVHDYLIYNPSAEETEHKKRVRAEAGRKGGQRSRPPTKPQATPEANASASAQADAQASGEAHRNPVPRTPSDLHPPPTNVGTRPDPAGEGSSLVDQAITLAATRYGRSQVEQGKGSSADGLARWWLQENAEGARVRAASLLASHDLTLTQLADALLSGNPAWLHAYRRREPA